MLETLGVTKPQKPSAAAAAGGVGNLKRKRGEETGSMGPGGISPTPSSQEASVTMGVMPLTVVVDDRIEVWEASSQPHILQVRGLSSV